MGTHGRERWVHLFYGLGDKMKEEEEKFQAFPPTRR